MDVPVTEEMVARQTPETQSIIRSLFEIIQRQKATIDEIIGKRLLSYLQNVFEHWHNYRAGKISRIALK
ncbi:MAG: hypothetical protein JWM11_3311 [Planctomycetaceae bacterium]|nr:hypothetical protein [Planctomycetaceae bacterium]